MRNKDIEDGQDSGTIDDIHVPFDPDWVNKYYAEVVAKYRAEVSRSYMKYAPVLVQPGMPSTDRQLSRWFYEYVVGLPNKTNSWISGHVGHIESVPLNLALGLLLVVPAVFVALYTIPQMAWRIFVKRTTEMVDKQVVLDMIAPL